MSPSVIKGDISISPPYEALDFSCCGYWGLRHFAVIYTNGDGAHIITLSVSHHSLQINIPCWKSLNVPSPCRNS